MRGRAIFAALSVVALAALLPVAVAAHPLGNFTINHYAGLRVGTNRIQLDVVIDQAEIPSFQERQRIDLNGDGTLSDAEIAAERRAACPRLAELLALTVGESEVPLTTTAAGLSFPPGAGGVQTMRVVCEYDAALQAPIAGPTTIRFEDHSNADRIGWREVVANGDGTTLVGTLPTLSVSARLTNYPTSMLAQPFNMRTGLVTARSGGPALPPFVPPDATPLAANVGAGSQGPLPPAALAGPAAVPGGVGGEIAGLLGARDLTPIALVLSFLTALALGAGHALTPGHGKTIMAAYLVGTRGSTRHAMGLGLATAVSHTIGVLVLALLIVAAGTALPADRLYPILAAMSGLIVTVIGAYLLATQASRWLATARSAMRTGLVSAGAGGHMPDPHPHRFGHVDAANHHGHDHASDDGSVNAASAGMAHPSSQAVASMSPPPTAEIDPALHRHGWRVHSHVPTTAPGETKTLTWRSLFALGLAGGLVPSTNALLILVATVAAGRAAYGLVLVVAFGIGMAAVLVGVGIAMVSASGLVGRVPRSAGLGRAMAVAPTGAAVAVLVLGLYLTHQALAGAPVL